MKINRRVRCTVPFEKIAIGDCFIYECMVYLKIPYVVEFANKTAAYSAIAMGSGKLKYFSDDCPVLECKATLTVEE